MSLNQNFPQIQDSWAPTFGANTGALPPIDWVEMTPRTRHQTTIRRGRQYETDQVQAGEMTTTWDNADGALDPTNTAGPWAGSIRPYSPIKRTAQWSPTKNILIQAIASGGEGFTSGTPLSTWSILSDTDSTGGATYVAGAGAYEETSVFALAVPSGTTNARVFSWDGASVVPGQTYSFQVQVANTTASTTVGLQAYLGWILSGATVSVLTKGTVVNVVGGAGYSTLTVTATAPANAFGMRVGLRTSSTTTTAAVTLWADGMQLEKGAAATSWVYPGYPYPQFAGFVERWPTQYTDQGARGEVQLQSVDAFALLSQTTLNDALTEELQGLNPRFLYRCDDPAGSTVLADSTGANPSPSFFNSRYGSGSYNLGQPIAGTDMTNGVFVGLGSALHFNNPQPGVDTSSGTPAGATMLGLHTAGIVGPANPKEFTRIIAYRYTGGTIATGGNSYLWSAFDNSNSNGTPTGKAIELFMSSTAGTGAAMYIQFGSTYNPGSWDGGQVIGPHNSGGNGNADDGNWHLIAFGYSASQGLWLGSIDGGYSTGTLGSYPGSLASGLVGDTIGSYCVTAHGNLTDFNFAGDVALVAEVPYLMTSSQVSSLYTTWKNAGLGESTGARYSRIIRYSGFTGNTWIDTGNTTSMGACDFSGTDVVSALQAVVDTESGAHHVRQTGTIRFLSRSSRYNALTPTLTFGENPGEIPYEDLQLDYDATHLANTVQVTQTSTGQVFTATDATSTANYFPRTMTRSINTTSALECQDAANYLLSRYKDPKVRVAALKVNLGGNPSAWASVLPLDLGARVRVMRRQPGAPAVQLDCFVEQMQYDFDDQNAATLTMQCSPADTTPYGLFAAWRSTIGSNPIGPGNLAIAVNPPFGGDNSNPLAAMVYVGQQLTIDPGTPQAETLTVAAVSASVAGSWSTATITFSTGTVNSHAGNAVICEALPGSTIVPTTWDTAAVFDSTNIAY